MKKSKVNKVIVIFIIVGIVLFGFLGYKVKNDFFKGSVHRKVDSIEFYGYTLSKNDTEVYKSNFKELSKVLNEKEINYTDYAKLISKLFIIDLYNLDNKLASTDIGGLEFLHKDLKENFKENMGSTLYNFVESNLDGKRTQELPIVKDVIVDDVFETKYTYNKTEYNAYIVSTTISYEKDLGYPKNMKLTIINDNNILYIVKGE